MYDLLLTEDETMVAESVRDFLASELPLERLRPNARPTDHAEIWQGMARLGWFGVGLPEAAGGSEMSLVEEVLIQRECGRFLVTPNVVATVLAGHVACHAGDTEAARAFASGEAVAALAIDAAPAVGGQRRTVLAVDSSGSDAVLYWNENGMGLFEPFESSQSTDAGCVDDSVSLHSGSLELGNARTWIDSVTAPLPSRASVLLSSALAGLAGHACDLAVEYAMLREQFGRPIGAFQAIKHRCADMAVRLRLAWYQTCLAALKLGAGAEDAPLQIASAKLLAAEAARENGRACIQIHGGIGFQAECDAHWFVKRAFLYDLAGGAMATQADRVIAAPRPEW